MRRLLLLRLLPDRLNWNVCLADYLTSCDRNVSQVGAGATSSDAAVVRARIESAM